MLDKVKEYLKANPEFTKEISDKIMEAYMAQMEKMSGKNDWWRLQI